MKCKRLCAWLLSLVMMFSLLPVSAAAAGTDVGSKAYDEIRIYLDAETKTDFDNLEGTLTKQVRIISPEYSGGDTLCFHNIEKTYWYAPNIIRKVTANDITRIDLVRDKALGHSSKIQIPIGGNEIYKVTISEGGSAKFLRIDITKRTPHAVKYVFASPAPETVSAPVDPAKYTETSSVTLLDPAEKSVTGTHEGRTGLWTFDGWTVKGDQTNTQISQADKKFIMPDEDVTVTGTWTFTSDPTPVYVYFKTVNTKNELVKVGSGVTYNANGSSWATLGELKTTADVATASAEDLGKEVIAGTGFTRHTSNSGLVLSLIKSWDALHQESGAVDYVDAGYVWHLDGKVKVYRAIYCDSEENELEDFDPNKTPEYYLKGAKGIKVTDEKPTAPAGKTFDCWVTTSPDVTVADDNTFIMPDHDVKFTPQWKPITADLIDDNIIIKHGVDANPTHGDDDDTAAHIVEKNATISYQATLDMQNLDFGANPEHADTVRIIRADMKAIGTTSLWDFIKNNSIGIFAGSAVNLHVKFSDKLENPTELKGIALESGWFKLDPAKSPTYDGTTKYWTIPCVIKNAEDAPDTSKSIITLSGVSLSLTDTAQDELSRDTPMTITSEGYIDGMIMISGRALKLESKTAKNTAKLKLAVPTYTVTYDANGGSGTMTDKNSPYAYGAAATVLTNGFTRSRYTFTGWNTQADGKGTSCKAGDSIDVTGNIVLYAQWSKNSSRDDDDDKYFFAIQKVDAQDGHALNGAKFKLYQLDKNDRIVNRRVVETRQQSSKNGIALFGVEDKNSYDGIWYYAEVSAPEGYVLDNTEHKIKATDFFDSLSTAVKYADTVRNYRGTTPDLLNDSDHFAYVIGYMDGNVRPYGLISRAETTTIFFRLLKDSVRDGNLLTSNTYTDVADDYWANTAISTMTGLGIVQGRSADTFDPKAPITRAQFAAICARFDTGKSSGTQSFTDIKGHWAEKYIERAAELGWIKGFEDGTFRPDTYITRAQAMTMINRVLNRIPEDESDLLPGMNVWPDCNPGDWFYLAIQEATNSHDYRHKAGSYETWTGLNADPDWTRYEN